MSVACQVKVHLCRHYFGHGGKADALSSGSKLNKMYKSGILSNGKMGMEKEATQRTIKDQSRYAREVQSVSKWICQ
jgi:hypothetical protein